MKVRFNRQLSAGLLAGALFLALLRVATPALADPPVITPILPGERIRTDVCAFPVQWTVVEADTKQMVLLRQDDDQMTLITGALFMEFTNLTTQKSVTLNVSGSFHEVRYPDGSYVRRLTGPSWIVKGPSQLPKLALFKGLFEYGRDAAGNRLPFVIEGSVTNICDLLTD